MLGIATDFRLKINDANVVAKPGIPRYDNLKNALDLECTPTRSFLCVVTKDGPG